MSSEAFGLPAMVAEVSATRLQALPARPPTPPRGSDSQAVQNTFLKRIFSPNRPQTPPVKTDAPTPSTPSVSSERSRKKVEWSAWTDYKDPPKPSSRGNPAVQVTPISKSASVIQKTPKSILKPYNGVIPVGNSSGNTKNQLPHTYPNFATMLESITKQLAGEDRSSRLDSYTTLNSVLKASDNVPDPRALKDKMGLLTQFIQRDMVAKLPSGSYDNTLITSSLILLATFLHKKAIAETLTTDFCAAVTDHAIGAFEGSQYSKDVTKHLMFIMAQQNFSAKVISVERVGRLLTALHNIEDKVKGKSIISGRIQIYQKLLKQSRNSFLTKTSWIRDIFTDMLSSFRDIRSLAINIGSEVALALGTERQASRAVMELFDLRRDNGNFGQYYAQRLTSMLSSEEDGEQVPQIWIVAVLFLRSVPKQLEQWSFIKPWLVVIQGCFNNNGSAIKLQAYHAWNKFVFVILMESNPSMIKMLSSPLVTQLKRKIGSRHTLQIRQSAMSSICNLLYYAFRPGSTFTQLDLYWDEYVVPIVGKLLIGREGLLDPAGLEAEDLSEAIVILTRLLDSANPRIWRQSLAFEMTTIASNALPSLDPRWIRKNYQRILPILMPAIKKYFWHLRDLQSNTAALWKAYVTSVASAGAKEIKVSLETMATIASIFEDLHNMWTKDRNDLLALPHSGGSRSFIKSYSVLLSTLIQGLGTLPFTEKMLALNSQSTFAAITTPSHRPGKGISDIRSPLDHLLIFLAKATPGDSALDDFEYTSMCKSILTPFLYTRDSRRARLEFLKDMNDLVFNSVGQATRPQFWFSILELAKDTLSFKNESSSSSGSSDIQPLGSEYRNVVRLLEKAGEKPIGNEWGSLYEELIQEVSATSGDAGCALAVIEPLSKAALEHMESDRLYHVCLVCTKTANYPKNSQALESSRRRLWGVAGQKQSQDPYLSLYACQLSCLKGMYTQANSKGDDASLTFQFICALEAMIKRCPMLSIVGRLCKIQDGLSLWVRDSERKMLSGPLEQNKIYRKVLDLWTSLCKTFKGLIPNKANFILLEPLLIAGFESVHKSIVLATIQMWNETFDESSKVEYSEALTEALQRVRHTSDIILPSFPEVLEDQFPPKFTLLESQDNRSRPKETPIPPPVPRRTLRGTPRSNATSSAPPKSTREVTPTVGKRSVKASTPRLRHDDSQIQFEAVESSPLSDAAGYSQVLTDRQLEVKERQVTEAAAYPELRSISVVHSTAKKGTRLRDVEFADTGETATSTAPRALQPTFEDVAQSSPTPHRNEATSLIDSDAIDLPSSPPEIISEGQNINSGWKSTAASTDYGDDVWNSTLPPTAPKPNGTPLLRAQRLGSSPELGNLPSTPIRTNSGSRNHTPKSPAEVFVDAVSSPAALSPGKAGSRWDSAKARNKTIGRGKQAQQPTSNSEATEAFSSPQQIHKNTGKRLSSSISDIDEDSVMRLMGEFDTNESGNDNQILPGPVKDMMDVSSFVESQEPSSAAELQKTKRRSRGRGRGRQIQTKVVTMVPETPAVEPVEAVRRSSRRLRSSVAASADAETPIRETKKRKIEDRKGEVPDSQELLIVNKAKRPKTSQQPGSSIPMDLTWDEDKQPDDLGATREVSCSVPTDMVHKTSDGASSSAMEITEDHQEVKNRETQLPTNSLSEVEEKSKAVTSQEFDANLSKARLSEEYKPSPQRQSTNEVPETSSTSHHPTGSDIINSFESLLTQLQSANVTRAEAMRIENALWDLKGALYDAEKRGRNV